MNRDDDYIDELESMDRDPLENVFEKIEQANLYKALLNQELFDSSAASEEIIEKVTQEIRQFVSQRLQMLVGLTPSEPVAQLSPFNDQQVEVLKVLADRIIGTPSSRREVPAPRPRKNIIKVRKPEVQKPNIQKSVTSNKPQRKPTRPASANVSEVTGQDYSQAINPNGRPLPQPTQAVVDARNAALVSKNTANMNAGDWGKILQAAATVYQKKNANIQED